MIKKYLQTNIKYRSEWESVGGHCPNCGSDDTLVESGRGDYYVGPEYCCLSCGCSGHMWHGDVSSPRKQFEPIS